MSCRDTLTFVLQSLDGRADRAVRRTPSEYEYLACVLTEDLDERDVLLSTIDFCLTGKNHQMMILRIVIHVTGNGLFLDAADAMLEPRRSGNRVRPRQRTLIA